MWIAGIAVIAGGSWPSLAACRHIGGLKWHNTSLTVFNTCFALGVLLFSLGAILMTGIMPGFTMYGILSGALLSTGTSIVFASQRTLGVTTTYSLSVAAGILTRYAVETHMKSQWRQFSYLWYVPYLAVSTAIVFIIIFHENTVVAGLASVSLDLYGVERFISVEIQATSVTMLKYQIYQHFWEAYVDVGDIEKLLLCFEDSDESTTLNRIQQLRPCVYSTTLRIVSSTEKYAEENSWKLFRNFLGCFRMQRLDSVGGRRDPSLDVSEANKRLTSNNAHYHTYRGKTATVNATGRRRYFQYFMALLGGTCLEATMLPVMHGRQVVNVKSILMYLPLVGFGSILVAPAMPGDNSASCVSYHLSRASSLNPFDVSPSVTILAFCSGIIWTISCLASAYCWSVSDEWTIYAVKSTSIAVNMVFGLIYFGEFEGAGMRQQCMLALFIIVSDLILMQLSATNDATEKNQ